MGFCRKVEQIESNFREKNITKITSNNKKFHKKLLDRQTDRKVRSSEKKDYQTNLIKYVEIFR